jgi:hypothetical protein
MPFAQCGRCALAALLAVMMTFAIPMVPASAGAKQLGHRHPGVHLARAHGAAAKKPKGGLVHFGDVAGESASSDHRTEIETYR